MKKIFFFILILVLSVCALACTGERKVVSVDFEGETKTVYDVDESFDFSVRGVVAYEDGSTESIRLTQENVVGFSTATTGEKTAKLVYKEVEKEFSYAVEYLAAPTKSILTDARLSLTEISSFNGAARIVGLDVGLLEEVHAVTFTMECTRAFGTTLEVVSLADGWDCRVKESNASAKILFFRRGGAPITGEKEILSISTVGYDDARFSLKDVVLSDGKSDYDLPNVKQT